MIYHPIVASFTDAWIETQPTDQEVESLASHLLQMRGLKLRLIDGHIDVMVSHLLQMRGLKQICHRIKRGSRRVASFTDAWIETLFFVNTQEE